MNAHALYRSAAGLYTEIVICLNVFPFPFFSYCLFQAVGRAMLFPLRRYVWQVGKQKPLEIREFS